MLSTKTMADKTAGVVLSFRSGKCGNRCFAQFVRLKVLPLVFLLLWLHVDFGPICWCHPKPGHVGPD
jgi:hypothetical protein